MYKLILFFFIFLCVIVCATKGVDGKQSVSSETILKKINNRESIDYTSYIIEGDLNLDDIDNSTVRYIDSPIAIIDCEIKGNVLFNRSVFNRKVDFEKTRFYGNLSFEGAQFQEGANFGQCDFYEYASFRNAIFRESSVFWKTRFFRFSTFRNARFDGSKADFHKCQFMKDASFNFANFNVDEATFEQSTFNYLVNFQRSMFKGKASFISSQFNEMADFSESQFNSSLDFLGAKFEKELYFNNVKFDRLNINWDSIRYKLISDEPGYIQLINNFRRIGQFADADNCYYQYREWKRINRPPSEWTEEISDYLSWLSCGYGIRWHHTLLSGIMVMGLFGLYYEIQSFKDIIQASFHKRGLENAGNSSFKESLKRAVSISAITLLSLPSDWYPLGRDEYTEFIKHHLCSAIFERIIGWGLMLLLIGTISRLMVRY
ncbi:MAG: pentapeptide repeat-containing protein [Methanotrichaceae archaeon]